MHWPLSSLCSYSSLDCMGIISVASLPTSALPISIHVTTVWKSSVFFCLCLKQLLLLKKNHSMEVEWCYSLIAGATIQVDHVVSPCELNNYPFFLKTLILQKAEKTSRFCTNMTLYRLLQKLVKTNFKNLWCFQIWTVSYWVWYATICNIQSLQRWAWWCSGKHSCQLMFAYSSMWWLLPS